MEILTKENLARAKTAPTAISRTFTPLLREPEMILRYSGTGVCFALVIHSLRILLHKVRFRNLFCMPAVGRFPASVFAHVFLSRLLGS